MFGFGRKMERGGGGTSASGETTWDTLKQVQPEGLKQRAEAGPSEEEQARLNAERQQRKIIRGLMETPYEGLKGEVTALHSGEQNAFLVKLATGQIGEAKEREFLSMMKDPRAQIGTEAMFQRGVKDDLHARRILGFMTEGRQGFAHPEGVASGQIESFLQKYPLPMDFEGTAEEFLEQIRKGNGEQKYQQYRESMAEFMQTMYGKRQEYWEQMKVLHERAMEWTLELPKSMATEMVETPRKRSWEKMTAGEQEKMLAKTRIDGDTWLQGEAEYRLTPGILAECGLGPEFKMNLEGREIGLSEMFAVGEQRAAVIAYVQSEKGVMARSFYRSNSQGVWRYLPDYVPQEGGGGVAWYGKGYDEESVTAPLEMQKCLSEMLEAQGGRGKEITQTVPEFLMAGTAKRYASKDAYREALTMGTLRGDLYEEVAHRAKVEFGRQWRTKVSPENLDVDAGSQPDFAKQISEWQQPTAMDGMAKVETFKSQNGELNWMMCQDVQGRAWVGGAETTAPITSTGLRSEWVQLGDLATPIYEYKTQIQPVYADYEDDKGRYVSTWKNYLSKVPLIRRYLESKR